MKKKTQLGSYAELNFTKWENTHYSVAQKQLWQPLIASFLCNHYGVHMTTDTTCKFAHRYYKEVGWKKYLEFLDDCCV